MKRTSFILAALLITLPLTGCFGNGDGAEDVGVTQQSFQNFTINIPSNWRKIFKEDFANTIPKETVALFVNRIDGQDFIQNANVVKESLNTDASSLEYAKANLLLGSKALIDYRPLATNEVEIGGVKTVVHLFRARNETTAPLRHYTQAYFARDSIGYTVTCIAADDNTSQQESCLNIARSFQLR